MADTEPLTIGMHEAIQNLRTKFDDLLVAEVKAYGGIPSYQGRCSREASELREAIAELLAIADQPR